MYRRKRKYLTEDEISYMMNKTSSSENESEGNISDGSELAMEDLDTSIGCVSAFQKESGEEHHEECDDDITVEETDAKTISWSKNIKPELIEFEKFISDEGPQHNLQSGARPSNYFDLLFSEEICEIIFKNTNKYAEFRQAKALKIDENWIPLENVSEVKAFLSIFLITGIMKLPRLRDYWSNDPILGNDMIKSLMSRNRFSKIMQYFHVSDREKEVGKGHEGYVVTEKLEPLISLLQKNFEKHMNPSKQLSVDEALVKFKGRLGIIQYMPLKPAKRGIKIWMMCTSTQGYVMHFEVYGGKSGNISKSDKGLGYDVVCHFAKKLKSKYHEIYFDRFFTSVPLILDLKKQGFYAAGTVMTNRKFLPNNLRSVKITEKGESIIFQCEQEANLLCSVWKDKKEIFMLSTNADNEIVDVRRRNGPEVNVISSPIVFKNYNQYMGGVDMADQLRSYYSVARKSKKWWLYIFWFLLDTAINNAHILYNLTNMPNEKNPKSLLQFKLDIITDLSHNHREIRKSAKSSNVGSTNSSHSSHKRIKIDGRKKTCRLCSKLKKKTTANNYVQSSWMCEICQVCLCIGCFDEYHQGHYIQNSV